MAALQEGSAQPGRDRQSYRTWLIGRAVASGAWPWPDILTPNLSTRHRRARPGHLD